MILSTYTGFLSDFFGDRRVAIYTARLFMSADERKEVLTNLKEVETVPCNHSKPNATVSDGTHSVKCHLHVLKRSCAQRKSR